MNVFVRINKQMLLHDLRGLIEFGSIYQQYLLKKGHRFSISDIFHGNQLIYQFLSLQEFNTYNVSSIISFLPDTHALGTHSQSLIFFAYGFLKEAKDFNIIHEFMIDPQGYSQSRMIYEQYLMETEVRV